jgi:hypothetical protein
MILVYLVGVPIATFLFVWFGESRTRGFRVGFDEFVIAFLLSFVWPVFIVPAILKILYNALDRRFPR